MVLVLCGVGELFKIVKDGAAEEKEDKERPQKGDYINEVYLD